MPCFRGHQVSLSDQNRGEVHATSDKADAGRDAARRQQIDLFTGEPRMATGGMPVWSGLPTETQAALTDLMTRLILDHARQKPRRLDDGGRP